MDQLLLLRPDRRVGDRHRMVMGNIADYFHLPVSSMSNTFTFLNAGILISIFLNARLMEIVPLKAQLRFGFILCWRWPA